MNMNRKYFLLVIFLLLQTIIIYAQPNQLKAVLTSVGNYNPDSRFTFIFPLAAEGNAANDIRTGLLAQAWNSSDITVLTNSFASKTAIIGAISALPSGTSTTNVFFFGGHGNNDGILAHNAYLPGYPEY